MIKLLLFLIYSLNNESIYKEDILLSNTIIPLWKCILGIRRKMITSIRFIEFIFLRIFILLGSVKNLIKLLKKYWIKKKFF